MLSRFKASPSENRLGHCLAQNDRHRGMLKSWVWKKSRSVLAYFVTQENDTSTSDAKHRHTQYEARLSSQERGAEADVVRG